MENMGGTENIESDRRACPTFRDSFVFLELSSSFKRNANCPDATTTETASVRKNLDNVKRCYNSSRLHRLPLEIKHNDIITNESLSIELFLFRECGRGSLRGCVRSLNSITE